MPKSPDCRRWIMSPVPPAVQLLCIDTARGGLLLGAGILAIRGGDARARELGLERVAVQSQHPGRLADVPPCLLEDTLDDQALEPVARFVEIHVALVRPRCRARTRRGDGQVERQVGRA